MADAASTILYRGPLAGLAPRMELVALSGPQAGQRFPFHDRLEIRRLEKDTVPCEGVLFLADPAISWRHCTIVQVGGRCYVRDTSSNGTRIDNHRLVPGVEIPFQAGQVLSLGQNQEFRLEGAAQEPVFQPIGGTVRLAPPPEVTLLAGDISGYTTLVREAPAEVLQQSVAAFFQRLEKRVGELDGTVKEYLGDALCAFWEGSASESCAVRACRAALVLEEAARALANDPAVWRLPEHPLRMDWALATGRVVIGSLGGTHPVGLSMIGDAVVRVFRLEKIADDSTGHILACARTRSLAAERFTFRPLGERMLEGYPSPHEVFALEEAR